MFFLSASNFCLFAADGSMRLPFFTNGNGPFRAELELELALEFRGAGDEMVMLMPLLLLLLLMGMSSKLEGVTCCALSLGVLE